MRWLLKVVATLVIVTLVSALAWLSVLQSRFGPSLLAQTTQLVSGYQLSTDTVSYTFSEPLHIALKDVSLTPPDGETQHLNSVAATLSLNALLKWRWEFEELSIAAPTLTLDTLAQLPSHRAHRLSLRDVSWQTPTSDASGVHFSAANWHFDGKSHQFGGPFQLQIADIHWHGIALEQLLITGERTASLWQIEAMTANGLGGTLSFSGDIDSRQGAYVEQLTAHKIKLDANTLAALQQVSPLWHNVDIAQISIIDSHIDLPDLKVQNLNANLAHWRWPAKMSEQQNGTISLTADSILYHDQLLDEPIIELGFDLGTARLELLSLTYNNGLLLASGLASDNHLALDELRLTGLEWLAEPQVLQGLSDYWQRWEEISINKLSIGNSQITYATPEFPVQLNGINISGDSVTLRRQHRNGLWDGELSVNLARGYFNQIALRQPALKMRSEQGNWTIAESFLPFDDGLLVLEGDVRLTEQGIPWQLDLNGNNIPAAILPSWLHFPINMEGQWDLQLAANGLAENATYARYSLDMEGQAQFRDVALLDNTTDNAHTVVAEVNATPFTISSQRGVVTMQPWRLFGQGVEIKTQGRWDLTQRSEFTLQGRTQCGDITQAWTPDLPWVATDQEASVCLGTIR
uniref:AsmA family protein n=1 Tax=Thaumasiovibrio occultus TaxID=1891184 RepID=UPI000B35321C|nr:AsmA family protein [Thaumasiovibrio occultus]